MGASIKYNFGAGQKKGYTYVDNFGEGQENCGCKCTHKFGALANDHWPGQAAWKERKMGLRYVLYSGCVLDKNEKIHSW